MSEDDRDWQERLARILERNKGLTPRQEDLIRWALEGYPKLTREEPIIQFDLAGW